MVGLYSHYSVYIISRYKISKAYLAARDETPEMHTTHHVLDSVHDAAKSVQRSDAGLLVVDDFHVPDNYYRVIHSLKATQWTQARALEHTRQILAPRGMHNRPTRDRVGIAAFHTNSTKIFKCVESKEEGKYPGLGWTGDLEGEEHMWQFWRMEEIEYDSHETVVTNHATWEP
ncbi:hypothetical protein P171DRAFT_484235 [Karstenula rhodostoma CBS 690.94]|uniref:Uncharacterized protein n=1 Tax=Karstenula rhodostoma CBS 690.94 TaxID=1392251 RepID=A0A9P4PK79_9PLEO|nr:hypothetical protein P171DRAFT_484235 [Karstenula rhodostoma CBS 690.94]